MKKCAECERLFEKALYNELSDSESKIFDEHISSCKFCAKKFAELRDTLSLVKTLERSGPDEDFMSNFWNELEPKLVKEKSPGRRWNFDISPIFQFNFSAGYKLAGAALVLVIGIIIGRYWFGGTAVNNPPLIKGKDKMTAPVNIQAAEYIERSKILLLGLMNFDPATEDAETISLQHIKKISRELVDEAPGLKAELKEQSQQRLGKLVSDLEVILLQIANLEAKNDIEGIELVKDGVNSKGIFLKINIQQLQENNDHPGRKTGRDNETKKENRKI